MRLRLLLLVVLASLATGMSAAVIYFADEAGNVGAYDDVTMAVTPVGDLSAFSISQVIGIAWDPSGQRILLFDRGAPAVYAMDPTTGNATLLFDPGRSFQGGAVIGNTVYGIDESSQTVEAYNLTTFADLGLSAAALPDHSHGLGENDLGQLYGVGDGDAIFTVNSDGSYGAVVVTTAAGLGYEDVDAYGDDFLVTEYDGAVTLVDGSTGAESTFLTAGQVTTGGLAGTPVGVTVGSAVVIGTADLEIDKTSSASSVAVGETFTYTLTVTNNGPDAATGVTVVDDLPDEVQYVSNSCGAGESGGTVTWDVGALAVDASATCTITVELVGTGDVQNTATVSADQTDPTPGNDAATVQIAASIAAIPTLSEWSLLAFALALGILAITRVRM